MAVRGKRAILLISVLLFAILITMFVTSALALAPSGFARAGAESYLVAADQATRSGIDWVCGRLSADPDWKAEDDFDLVTSALVVHEGDGQVVGWVCQDQTWARFRLRFNYQDGAASAAANSDGMDDPPNLWTDLPYVSCNNLVGAGARVVPLAGDTTSYVRSSPWPTSQISLPSNTLLLSVEGTAGPTRIQNGEPVGFSSLVHRRVSQAVLKFGNNQPVTGAAIMAAGDLSLKLYSSNRIHLSSTEKDTARLRSKGNLSIPTGVQAAGDAELRYGPGGSTTLGTLTPGVSVVADPSGDGFFQIPAAKVRTPSNPVSLAAGTYVVTAAGTVVYFDMDYATYASANPRPVGSAVSLPTGVELKTVGNSPKYRLTISQDIAVTASGSATDFVILPEGGVVQSEGYGGVAAGLAGAAASATPPPAPTPTPLSAPAFVQWMFQATPMDTPAAWQTWTNFASNYPVVSQSGSNRYYDMGNGVQLKVPKAHDPSGWNQVWVYPSNSAAITVLTNQLATDPAVISALMAAYNYPSGKPSATPTPTPTPSLPTGVTTSDLEVQLVGGDAPITISNPNGSIVFGSQIQGNGAALVSAKDILLIGTSTELSSTPGAQLGLNLYAPGKIVIDAYQADASGTGFHGVDLKGIIYAWNDISILVANASSSARFRLSGTLVAYGGDPAGSPTPGTAKVRIEASDAQIRYDSSYVANLMQSGPFVLRVVSWHEF